MPVMRSNRILPVVGALVLLIALVVAGRTFFGEKDPSGFMDEVPQAARPDADSPAETIRALSAQVSEMGAGVEDLRRKNAEVLGQKRDLEAHVSREVEEAIATAEQRRAKEPQDTGLLRKMMERVDALSAQVSDAAAGGQSSQPEETELPVGAGLAGAQAAAPDSHGYVWTEPLDVRQDGAPGAGGGILSRTAASTGTRASASRDVPSGAALPASGTPALASGAFEPAQSRPYYTVPRNATLVGSTAMTALVGRIPVQGRVQDPWPFKVITGADNLAANGLSIPHVNGMIWSGTAIGDWTLGCVSGRLHSVTFVFDDGRIQTVSEERLNQGEATELGPQDEEHLGWISDRFGNPCVNGKRVSNAPSWIAQRTGLAALKAAGEAAAAGEATRTASPLFGTSTTTVDGDVGTYIAGKGVAGGADEIAQWLSDRMGQSFDAVFAPAGAKIAIHVDQEIPIDYDPNGRRLNHAQDTQSGHAARLD